MSEHDPHGTGAWRLVVDLVGDPTHPLADELLRWASASARDRTWIEANSGKIRKKLRAAADADALADVAAELRAAAALLADRRFELAFEAYGSGNAGPDFSATFRGGARLNLEVTRPRAAPSPDALAAAILGKLRQLPPSVPNVLVLALEAPVAPDEIAAAALGLRARADARDPRLLERAGADGPRAFYERYLRLGAVLAWPPAGQQGRWRCPVVEPVRADRRARGGPQRGGRGAGRRVTRHAANPIAVPATLSSTSSTSVIRYG